MNLIIDQGNTATKLIAFEGNSVKEKVIFSKNELVKAQAWITDNISRFNAALISSVTNDVLNTEHLFTIRLDANTPIPIGNAYKTPKTLGRDRLANAVAAWAKNPIGFSLIIDLGTCIKYDLVNSKGTYLGGNISPGLTMRYKALHEFTDQLPLLDPETIKYEYGTDTHSSLTNGVQHAILHEINGFINRYKEEFGQLTIFMTGGDLKYFDNGDKNSIFAHSTIVETELTGFGLNEILTYNVRHIK